ncbi:MAG: helix-turn-helix domain-containing protein [Coriobacteriales bacterium]|jgi:transcriptional regulator with XRE-family HTH domain|nr:helix-turn-helix domain-containing protein [Coriobacteriales bacterium]
MVTELGKFLRKIRIDNDELLKDMADKIGMSSAMLSSIENAKRNVPLSFAGAISQAYELSGELTDRLEYCIALTKEQVQIRLENLSKDDKRLAFSFARRFSELDDEKKLQIRKIMSGGD